MAHAKYNAEILEKIAAKVVGTLAPLATIAAVGIAITVLVAIPDQVTRLVPSIVASILLLLDWWLVRSGRIRIAAHLLVALGVAAMLTGMALNGGTRSMIFGGVSLTLLAVIGWLYGSRSAVLFTIFCITVGGLFVLLDSLGWLPDIPQASPLVWWVSVSCYLLMVLGATAIPNRMLHQALIESEEQRTEAEESRQREIAASGALADSEERFRALVTHIPGVTYRCAYDEQWTMEFISDEIETLTGYPPSDFLGNQVRSYSSIIHSADADMVDRIVAEAIAKKATYTIEYRVVDAGGEVLWVYEKGQGIFDADGIVRYLDGVIVDITQRVGYDEALRESEERYRNFVANASEGIFRIDFTDDIPIDQTYDELEKQIGETAFIAEVNDALSNMYGLSPAQMTGEPVRKFAPECGKQMADLMQQEEYRISELESQEYDADGNQITIVESYSGIVEDGLLKRVWGVQRDISDRKRADEERFRLSTAVEQAAESIVITDVDGTIRYVNPSFEKVTGYARTEAIGKNTKMFRSGKHTEEFYETLWNTIGAGETWKGRLTNKRKDGTLYEEEAVISPIRDGEGSVISFVAVKRDVTQEVLMEGQLRQAQKMEAIGQLAGGIAHDFNNLLTAIMGYSEIIKMSLAQNDPLFNEIREIGKAATRAAELTGQLLAFSRKQIIHPKVIDLNEVISLSQKMLARIIGEDIELVFNPGTSVGRIKADPTQIDQVLVNLAVNARDAMPNGGRLAIETQNIHREDVPIPVGDTGEEIPGDFVMLAISDNGCGMDDETRKRIFEPFFSTKGQGKGTGLGLATVYGIVAQNNGYIDVDSEVDAGTRFEVCLPRTLGPAESLEQAEHGDLPRGTETVLLVEDEDMVRHLASKILRKQGYHVIEADDGGDAYLQSKKYGGEIHLLLTDVVMPNMNGRELYDELSSTRPGLKVLFMSGYADDVIGHHGVLEEGTQLMQKPFTIASLAQRVREVIDG